MKKFLQNFFIYGPIFFKKWYNSTKKKRKEVLNMAQINDVLSSSTMSSLYTSALQSAKAKKEEELKAQQENPAANAVNIVSTANVDADKEVAEAEKKDAVGPAYSVELSKAGILLSEASAATAAQATTVVTDVKEAATDVEVKAAVNKIAGAESGEQSVAGAPPAGAPPTGAPPAGKPPTTSTEEDESSESSSSLAQYTEAQLQEMLSKGEISQTAYVSEIAQRKASDEKVILELQKQEVEEPKEAANSDDIVNKKQEAKL